MEETLSTHQSDGGIYTKHQQDGSWTGMLDEIVKDLSLKFALSSSSISEIFKRIFAQSPFQH